MNNSYWAARSAYSSRIKASNATIGYVRSVVLERAVGDVLVDYDSMFTQAWRNVCISLEQRLKRHLDWYNKGLISNSNEDIVNYFKGKLAVQYLDEESKQEVQNFFDMVLWFREDISKVSSLYRSILAFSQSPSDWVTMLATKLGRDHVITQGIIKALNWIHKNNPECAPILTRVSTLPEKAFHSFIERNSDKFTVLDELEAKKIFLGI